jgi:glycosyltransferase involved in cell wall biosynthesis
MADLVWNKLHILNVERLVGKLDVFHSSDWTQPPSRALKVTTIHDLVPIKYPKTVRKDLVRKIVQTHLSRLYWVKKEVDLVIAVSNSTKKDIMEYLGIPENKIRVIYEAADPAFYRSSEEEVKLVKQKYKIYDDYFLVVGDDPRKNLDRILQAYERVRPETRYKLVIAKDGLVPEGRGVIHVKGFSRSELAALYSGAKVLIFASLYEGFGLPIIEAFACGCPVVTSNVSSMPEIAGGAGVLVDPNEVDSIVDGIKNALKNSQSLIRKGYRRAKDFSWRKTAEQTIKVYEEVKSS